MKVIRWFIPALVASSMCVSPLAYAQQEKPQVSKEEIQQRLDAARERLKLTDEQVAAIKPVLQQEAQKLRAMRDKYGDNLSRRDKRNMFQDAKSIQQSFNSEMQKILDDDQMKIWKEMQAEARAKLKEEYQRRKAGS